MLNPVKQYTASLNGIIFYKDILKSVDWKTGSGWSREIEEFGGLYCGYTTIWEQNQGYQDQSWIPGILFKVYGTNQISGPKFRTRDLDYS